MPGDVLAAGPFAGAVVLRQNASDVSGCVGVDVAVGLDEPFGDRAHPHKDALAARSRISVLYSSSHDRPSLTADGVICPGLGSDDECVDALTTEREVPSQFGDAAREGAGQLARDDVPVGR